MKQKKNQNMLRKMIIVCCLLIIMLSAVVIAVRYHRQRTTDQTPAPVAVTDALYQLVSVEPKGTILTDSYGRTLYTYVPDPQDESNCTGMCLDQWTPYKVTRMPESLPKNFTIITRPDRTQQYAYKHKPLYLFIEDEGLGSTRGEGIDGFWFLARP